MSKQELIDRIDKESRGDPDMPIVATSRKLMADIRDFLSSERVVVLAEYGPDGMKIGADDDTHGEGFQCPKCGGSHFGSSHRAPEYRVLESRRCHDEFQRGCRFEYVYPVEATP